MDQTPVVTSATFCLDCGQAISSHATRCVRCAPHVRVGTRATPTWATIPVVGATFSVPPRVAGDTGPAMEALVDRAGQLGLDVTFSGPGHSVHAGRAVQLALLWNRADPSRVVESGTSRWSHRAALEVALAVVERRPVTSFA